MPTYEYYCEQCDATFEKVQKFTDAPLTVCPDGHEGVRKVFNAAGIIFKGSGWYIKDKNNGSNNAAASSSSNTKSGATDETKKDDSDSDSDTTAKKDDSGSDTTAKKDGSKKGESEAA